MSGDGRHTALGRIEDAGWEPRFSWPTPETADVRRFAALESRPLSRARVVS